MKKMYCSNGSDIPYERLGFSNHFVFGKVMKDKELCMKLLTCLTGNDVKDITDVIVENDMRITYDSKGIRYDVYVEDSSGRIYDAEIQHNNSGIIKQLPYRIRFYQGLVDLMALEKGMDYTKLKASYVIFICTFDPFKQGKACYAFTNICHGNTKLPLNDGRMILIFNTKGDLSALPDEIGNLLNYIETGKVRGEFIERLEEAVNGVRHNKEWRSEYMRTLVYNNDLRNEGRAEGRNEGLQALVNSLKKFYPDFDELYNEIISNKYYEDFTREEVSKYY